MKRGGDEGGEKYRKLTDVNVFFISAVYEVVQGQRLTAQRFSQCVML